MAYTSNCYVSFGEAPFLTGMEPVDLRSFRTRPVCLLRQSQLAQLPCPRIGLKLSFVNGFFREVRTKSPNCR